MAYKTMAEMRNGAARSALASSGKKKGKRNYRKEYDEYHAKPEQRKNRSTRNKARRKLDLKPGDENEVDHKTPLSKGGGNATGNLRATSRTKNRKKYNK